MFLGRLRILASLALGASLAAMCAAQAAEQRNWLGTWAASPMQAEGGFKVHAFGGSTVREIVHISVGGHAVRVRFSNAFGLDSLVIGNAHVALSGGGAAIKAGTDHALTFAGATAVKVPPGAELYSDPVAFEVAPKSDLAVSLYLPPQVMRAQTFHDFANQDNFMAAGDQVGNAELTDQATIDSWYFLDGIDVPAAPGGRAIVTLGDSITDGALSTHNANLRWPDVLAARLLEDTSLGQVSVLNEGIGGNRVLNDGYGPSALARFNRDVLAQNGVKYVILLEGINDIGRLARISAPDDDIGLKDLERGMKQIADAAHNHGIKAIGATLTPYVGAGYSTEKGEQIRKELNDWIRTSGTFDGVIDFDKTTADAAHPDRFNPAYDSGDHLHPADAGYKAMGQGIDLKLFAR